MTVLMEDLGVDGRVIHRCNSRCHNARGYKCKCICGGHYHGAARAGTLDEKVKEYQKNMFALAELFKQDSEKEEVVSNDKGN